MSAFNLVAPAINRMMGEPVIYIGDLRVPLCLKAVFSEYAEVVLDDVITHMPKLFLDEKNLLGNEPKLGDKFKIRDEFYIVHEIRKDKEGGVEIYLYKDQDQEDV